MSDPQAVDEYGTPAMFGTASPPVDQVTRRRWRAVTASAAEAIEAVSRWHDIAVRSPGEWVELRDSALPCDDCMLLHACRPAAPLARRARWRYVHRDGDRLLCGAHADHWGQHQ